jgi:hypothetical protein
MIISEFLDTIRKILGAETQEYKQTPETEFNALYEQSLIAIRHHIDSEIVQMADNITIGGPLNKSQKSDFFKLLKNETSIRQGLKNIEKYEWFKTFLWDCFRFVAYITGIIFILRILGENFSWVDFLKTAFLLGWIFADWLISIFVILTTIIFFGSFVCNLFLKQSKHKVRGICRYYKLNGSQFNILPINNTPIRESEAAREIYEPSAK